MIINVFVLGVDKDLPVHPYILIQMNSLCQAFLETFCVPLANSVEQDQIAQMSRLILIYSGRKCPRVGFHLALLK